MINDAVNRPTHYQANGITYSMPECIHISHYLGFSLGNAYKYVWRAGKKGEKIKEIEDLEKALWYLKYFQKFPTHNEMSKVARQLFSLLIFQDEPTETYRKEALEAIVKMDLDTAIANVEDLITHFIWKDFRQAASEDMNCLEKLLGKSLPRFVGWKFQDVKIKEIKNG